MIRLILIGREGTAHKTVKTWAHATRYMPTNGTVSVSRGTYMTVAIVTITYGDGSIGTHIDDGA